MNFYLVTLFHFVLLFSLISASLASPQSYSFLQKSKSQPIIQQNQISLDNSSDEDYFEGCMAILGGFDTIDFDPEISPHFFATWENQNPDQPFLNYFDLNNGMIAKKWTGTGPGYFAKWTFELKIYDGKYVDQKFIVLQGELHSGISILQSNGTLKTSDVTLSIQYGENHKVKFKKDVIGQFSFYFMNKDTKDPVTSFDGENSDIEKNTVQIMFISSDKKMSFKTSLFTSNFDMSTLDVVVTYLFPIAYIISTFSSWYSPSLGRKVSLGSIQAVWTSSAFVAFWLVHSADYYGWLFVLFVLIILCDFLKNYVFLLRGLSVDSLITGIGILYSFLSGALVFIPLIWINLFPCVLSFGPLLQKIRNRKYQPQHYLTRFEITSWISLSLWVGYSYLYPHNFYLISPKPILASICLGIIFLQFLIALIMQKTQKKDVDPLLQEEEEENSADQALPQTSNYQNEVEASSGDETSSRRKKDRDYREFRYTFGWNEEENYSQYIMECKICGITDRDQKLYKTLCGHVCHERCLKSWATHTLQCPICKEPLAPLYDD